MANETTKPDNFEWTPPALARDFFIREKTLRGRARANRPERADERTKRYAPFTIVSPEGKFWMGLITPREIADAKAKHAEAAANAKAPKA